MGYKQLPDERFEKSGIARPYAYLDKNPEELEALLGIKFVDSFDDLDYCDIALLEINCGLLFGLLHHKRAPIKNLTTVLGHELSEHPREELEQLMEEIGWDYNLVIPCYEKITDSIVEDILLGKITDNELPLHFEIILSNFKSKLQEPKFAKAIAEASQKFPVRVQRHLSKIFFYRINIDKTSRSLPWKDFKGDVKDLELAVKSKNTDDEKRLWALENLMITGVLENVEFALGHSKNPEALLKKFGKA